MLPLRRPSPAQAPTKRKQPGRFHTARRAAKRLLATSIEPRFAGWLRSADWGRLIYGPVPCLTPSRCLFERPGFSSVWCGEAEMVPRFNIGLRWGVFTEARGEAALSRGNACPVASLATGGLVGLGVGAVAARR